MDTSITLYQSISALLKIKIDIGDVAKLKALAQHYQTSKEMKMIDSFLPYIVFVRYHEGVNRGLRPLEFLSILFHEKLLGVRLLQTFIYGKGCSDFINPS